MKKILLILLMLLTLVLNTACEQTEATSSTISDSPNNPNFSPEELEACYFNTIVGIWDNEVDFDITLRNDCTGRINFCESDFYYTHNLSINNHMNVEILNSNFAPGCPVPGDYLVYAEPFGGAGGTATVVMNFNGFGIVKNNIPALEWRGVPR